MARPRLTLRFRIVTQFGHGWVEAPEEWPWSSYEAMMGTAPAPSWLAMDALLSQFGASREKARRRYRAFVYEGIGQEVWDAGMDSASRSRLLVLLQCEN